MYWLGAVFTSLLPNGLMHLLVWLAVRDAECPDCAGMLHGVPSRTVENLHRCKVCERLWVRRDGVYRAHVPPPDPKEPHGSYLR